MGRVWQTGQRDAWDPLNNPNSFVVRSIQCCPAVPIGARRLRRGRLRCTLGEIRGTLGLGDTQHDDARPDDHIEFSTRSDDITIEFP